MAGTAVTVQNGHTYLVACAVAYNGDTAGIQSVTLSGTTLNVLVPLDGTSTPFDVIDLGAGDDTSHQAKVLLMTPDGIFSASDYDPAILTRRALYNLANGKQDPITIDTEISSASNNPVRNSVIYAALQAKQDTLVSGTNIKTVNGTTLLGSGNLSVGLDITTYGS